jgi:predicted RecB family nuclease
MRLLEGRLLLGATDLADYLSCEHLTQLSLRVSGGEEIPETRSAMRELLRRLGDAHESRWLESTARAEHTIKAFDPDVARHATTLAELESAHEAAIAAMREGWDIIYQPSFFDGRWQGRADFLVRVEMPSDLGPFSYEVVDAKLARHVRARALLQLCEYSHQVALIQGRAPEHMSVVLGDGSERQFSTSDFAAYHMVVRGQLLQAVQGAATYPDRVAHCQVCDYADFCAAKRRRDDHLSLVARIRRDQIRKLNAVGVTTLAELGSLSLETPPAALPRTSFIALREQARLQLAGRHQDGDAPLYELLPQAEDGFGLSALPEPTPADVFFDLEGDPYAPGGPLQYLFGAVHLVDGAPAYSSWLGHDSREERHAFEWFIDWLMARLDANPAMHVYHYGDYERGALQQLMGRHGTREIEVDRLLRGEVLVDLYRVVRQSLRLSTESYGLKAVERLYMPRRAGVLSDGETSIVMYEEWLQGHDDALLRSIVGYNEVDCTSTMLLRGWLESRRAEVEAACGAPLPRPLPKTGEASAQLKEYESAAEALRAELVARVPEAGADRSAAEDATWLLAQLLAYHRREAKVGWWRWYRLIEMTPDDLAEDADALGPLTVDRVIGREKSSDVVRYRFTPQEHRLRVGDKPCTPVVREGRRDGASAGAIVGLDNVAGTVDLKRGPVMDGRPHPEFLIPERPLETRYQAEALLEIGWWVASNGVDARGPHRAACDLLLRRRPRGRDVPDGPLRRAGESAEQAALRVAAGLDGGCLAIQGPPGAGKTYTAARIALQLVAQGARVAVTATSHKAIGNLLREISGVAARERRPVRVMQRASGDDVCDAPGVAAATNQEVDAAVASGEVDVVGGTAWLFARPEVRRGFDTIIVEEAGQMALADVVAVSRCARNIVLVGDPRQLAHVVQGSHPEGAEASALEHLLGDQLTVADDRGIFLDRTWRMRSDVCAFVSRAFYEGKLLPEPSCDRQTITGDGGSALTGLRIALVEHEGDRTYSETEARRVASLVSSVRGCMWEDAAGTVRPLELDDILVVAPYNAHVACLKQLMPDARVGTVDKFQGQEAAVSIFSMATSSAEDLPRNLEFLYSLNRLNVAVSRARCLSVLVCSPALLRTRCHTPEQMRLVNALCRYAEMAVPWVDVPWREAAEAKQLTLISKH